MRRCGMGWLWFWLLLISNVYPVLTSTLESDVTALKAFSKGWNLGWSGDDPCGANWKGVSCDDSQHNNVTKLTLNSMNIVGRLLPSVGTLTNIEALDLSFNPELTGDLPRSLGNLQNLKSLNLQGCGFTGSIPSELGQLRNLKFLALNMNKLSGSIPPELGNLSQLYWFDLAQNGISGPLPISTNSPQNIGLDNLTEALHFHLNNNTLSGSFPKEICSLPKLIHLLLDSNSFTGKVPVEIGNFSKLQILRLGNNQFDGPLPSTIGKVSTLTEIHAKNNILVGKLPDLSGLTGLMLLSISNNVFDPQPVPSALPSLSQMQTIEIDEGNLIGPIPRTLFELPMLESVSFIKNTLNGSLDLSTASSSLASIELDDNKIAGYVGNSNSYELSLGGNPACNDSRLHLSPQVCQPKALASWKPSTSSCQKACSDQKTLNPNTCTCAFPFTILFTFTAPTFSSVNVTRIDILRNALATGLNLSMDQFWVDDAHFTDSHRLLTNVLFFPRTNVDRFTDQEVSFILNKISTHQLHLDYYGPYALSPVIVRQGGNKSKGFSTGAIAGIAAAAGLILIVVAVVSIYAFRQKKRADKAIVSSHPFASWGSGGKDSGSAPQLKGARYFTFAELKKATNNFSSSNEIGVGGYGKVYRGTILSGEEVAIKRAQEGSMQGAHEFKTEIELLSRVHHRNLVGLIGFCYEQGEQMLVYDYMANGTIRDHLVGHSEALTWRKRLEIAVGSAKGLAYLHELANPPIIHRDIKSSNILLDDKFVAKVADFGLSKLAPTNDGKGHVSTQVKGTLGYLDPEYYMTQRLTEKSDVYSFGVVLLELITARQPIEHGKYIVREVKSALEKGGSLQLLPLLDPYMKDYPRTDLDQLVDLALRCVEESAEARPTMNDVAKELEVLLSNVSSAGFASDSSNDRNRVRRMYNDPAKAEDPSFQYSGGFPHRVEPNLRNVMSEYHLQLSTESGQ